MAKRLILLLDGTWNDWESGDNDTNIVRLEDLIVSHLEREGATPREMEGSEGQRVHGALLTGWRESSRERTRHHPKSQCTTV